jgi:hypothetical protein
LRSVCVPKRRKRTTVREASTRTDESESERRTGDESAWKRRTTILP